MRTAALIMVIVSLVFGMGGIERVDSILTKAKNVRDKGVKGFIVQQHQEDIDELEMSREYHELTTGVRPDSARTGTDGGDTSGNTAGSGGGPTTGLGGYSGIFGAISGTSGGGAGGGGSSSITRTSSRGPLRNDQSFVSIDRYSQDREKHLRETTELRIQLDRLTTAVGYMVDHSSDQTKMIQLMVKLLEALAPIIIAIGGWFGWSKVKKKMSSNGTLNKAPRGG